jgi:hypothetical protein
VLLAPLQIPLHLLDILESSLHSGARFRKTSLCFCAQLLNLALLVVEFAGSVILSVMDSSIAARNYRSRIIFSVRHRMQNIAFSLESEKGAVSLMAG